MEIIILLFAIAFPVAFFVWTLRFKSILALTIIVPLLLLNLVVYAINSDVTSTVAGSGTAGLPTLQYTHSDVGCGVLWNNATATTIGNSTEAIYNQSLDCKHTTKTDEYLITPQFLEMLNTGLILFNIIIVFLVIRRVIISIRKNEE